VEKIVPKERYQMRMRVEEHLPCGGKKVTLSIMPINAIIKRAIQSSRNHEPIISSSGDGTTSIYKCSRKKQKVCQ